MAEKTIQIADKPTLDEIKAGVDAIKENGDIRTELKKAVNSDLDIMPLNEMLNLRNIKYFAINPTEVKDTSAKTVLEVTGHGYLQSLISRSYSSVTTYNCSFFLTIDDKPVINLTTRNKASYGAFIEVFIVPENKVFLSHNSPSYIGAFVNGKFYGSRVSLSYNQTGFNPPDQSNEPYSIYFNNLQDLPINHNHTASMSTTMNLFDMITYPSLLGLEFKKSFKIEVQNYNSDPQLINTVGTYILL